MESSDIPHNETAGPQFQRIVPEDAKVTAHKARYVQMAERRRVLLEQSERARFWFAVRTALTCVAGCLIGLIPMAWALHTTDQEMAGLAWAVGQTVGPALVVITLILAAIKWDRDDW